MPPDKQAKRIAEYLNKDPENFKGDAMARISRAGNGLLQWVKAMMEFHEVAKSVEPKRRRVAELQQEKGNLEKSLETLTKEIERLQKEASDLESKKNTLAGDLETLQQTVSKEQVSIESAEKVLEGMKAERSKWMERIDVLSAVLHSAPGDCLLAASFLSHAGTFNSEARTKLVRQRLACLCAINNGNNNSCCAAGSIVGSSRCLHSASLFLCDQIEDLWKPGIKWNNINGSEVLNIPEFLAGNDEVVGWTQAGLPPDPFSLQNAALIKKAARWPLCIDPMQWVGSS